MTTSYFADIPPARFEGVDSLNPFAYRYYDRDRVVLGKRMEDHLRMAVCYCTRSAPHLVLGPPVAYSISSSASCT